MVTPNQISWGSYLDYEGPVYYGCRKFTMPDEPTETDKIIAVITAAEGGHYDAINMYDRGIVSVGLIQWIEWAQYSVSDMLGLVIEQCGEATVLTPLKPALDLTNSSFKKNAAGKWRFHFNDSRGEVNTAEKQQALFLGCTGRKGSWTPAAILRAKLWASCIANVWASDAACRAQNEFTRSRLKTFVPSSAASVLFDSTPDEGWAGALRAAYYSFAINLPAVAAAQLKVAVSTSKHPKWSAEWCTTVLRQLTYGGRIGIYPARYGNVKPILEKLWGVSLPNAKELSAWKEPPFQKSPSLPQPPQESPVTLETVEIRPDDESAPAPTQPSQTAVTQPLVRQPDQFNIFTFIAELVMFVLSLLGGKRSR